MDRLRRSFRKSFNRGGKSNRLTANQQNSMDGSISASGTSAATNSSSKNSFQQDEAAVRGGTCQFQVKYLGSCEVFESRGMNVCENALRHLRERKRSTKAILYVSGDSLRVVDQEHSRGLILDQTVEKVSFCAPDRRNDKGFAYICRDGATRRWMCHGFQASERLSHAVGCSFAICLEKKKKREVEIEVLNTARSLADEVNADRNGLSRSNQAYNSFRRQLSLSERRQDPQKAIMVEPIPIQRPNSTVEGNLLNLDDVSVTSSKPSTFDRQQSSFHVSNNDQPAALRRFHSLRTDIQNKISRGNLHTLYNEPIYEGDDDEAWPGCENQFDNGSFSARTPRDQNFGNNSTRSNDQNKENGVSLNGLSISGSGFTLKPLSTNGPTTSAFNGQSNSLSSNQHPITSTTTAEDWLEKALNSNLTVSTSTMQYAPLVNGSYGQQNGINNAPPSNPPPPLPPSSILSSPNKNIPQQSQELDVPQPTKQSIKYQLLEETDFPPHSPPRLTSPLNKGEVDLFGQPIFNPLQQKSQPNQEVVEPPSAFVQLCSQKSPRQNGISDYYGSNSIKTQNPPITIEQNKSNDVQKKTEEVDPFDVGWSTQVLESARSTSTPTSTPRNNPFNGEKATVNV